MDKITPAFPRAPSWSPDGDPHHAGDDGMSLRDYFAAQALGAFSAGQWPGKTDADHIAGIVYAISDAMMAERYKTWTNCGSCGAITKTGETLCEVCTNMGVTADDLTSVHDDF